MLDGRIVRARTILAGAALAVAATPALANIPEPTLQDRQQAACYGDVMRLCREFVPDVDATKACMSTKKALVSPACAAFYPPSAPTRGRKPKPGH